MDLLKEPELFLEKANLLAFTLNHIRQLSVFDDVDEIGDKILSLHVSTKMLEILQYSDGILELLKSCKDDLIPPGLPPEKLIEVEEFQSIFHEFVEQMIVVREMIDHSTIEENFEANIYLIQLKDWERNIEKVGVNSFLLYTFWASFLIDIAHQ